jgi:hypothetical protein
MHIGGAVLAGALGGALVLAACGNDDDGDGALEPGAVTIAAVDYAFEGIPERIAAGSTIELTNASEVEVHEAVVVRIPDGVDLTVEELLELSDEELDELIPPGPPDMVIVAPPGEEGFVVVGSATLTEPGRYAVICFIPTGADPEEFMAAGEAPDAEGPPDVEGGPPHFVHGMFAELTVE